MIIKKIDRHVINSLNKRISEEAKSTLENEGVRASFICAFLFLIVSSGAGFLLPSLIIGVLETFSLSLSAAFSDILILLSVFFFAAPAYAGIRTLAAQVCNANSGVSGLFVAFSSPERLASSYLGVFMICLRYTAAYFILGIPELVFAHFDKGEEIAPISLLISFIATLTALALWYLLTARLGRLSYYIWSVGLPFFKALRESYKGRFISLGITIKNIGLGFLTAATACILLIFHTGPLWFLEGEISMRLRKDIEQGIKYEKLRKDGQDK